LTAAREVVLVKWLSYCELVVFVDYITAGQQTKL